LIAALLFVAAILVIIWWLLRARPRRFNWQVIDVNGVQRRYLQHVAEEDLRDRPLLLCFHGGRAQVERLARRSGLAEAGAQHGCIVIFPEAREGWIDLRPERGGSARDLEFVDALLDLLIGDNRVDPSSVFAVGISNGGQFVFRLACERPGRFAAVATALSNLPVAALSWRSAPPVPIALIFGRRDRVMPWEGGRLQRRPGLPAGGEVVSAPATVRFWVERNRAQLPPQRRRFVSAGHEVEIEDYAAETAGAGVRSVTVAKWGHRWPRWDGGPPASTDRFNAANVVMEFFAEQSLSGKTAPTFPGAAERRARS